jgi:small subunit ribosomal protein S8
MMTDPIADMLTRIRNALQARHSKVDVPNSKLKLEIARILRDEGYIQNYKTVEESVQGNIRLFLRRAANGEDVIEGLERVSTPGCRIYCGKDDIPKVRGGLGINILSTSKGVMTGKRATETGVGGEILCNIW